MALHKCQASELSLQARTSKKICNTLNNVEVNRKCFKSFLKNDLIILAEILVEISRNES